MQKPTLDQAIHLLQQVKDQNLDLGRLQKFFDAGLITGLLKADIEKVGEDLKRIFAGQQIPPMPVNDLADGGITFSVAFDVQLWLADQRKFFREVYGKNLPKVKMPLVSAGFGWGIIMAPFMGVQWLFDCSKERFGNTWKWVDKSLDAVIVYNDRDPKKDGPHAVWCRPRAEADEELKNKSFNDLLAAKINCMTCAERLNLGIWFHWKTGGKHLDVENITLCKGSRAVGGYVPYVFWYGRLYVRGFGPGCSCDYLRARQVISC